MTVAADLRAQLNAVVTNSYCVNEKNPLTYDREWKLHVLWRDGSTSQYRGRDEDGSEFVYRKALDEATRKGLLDMVCWDCETQWRADEVPECTDETHRHQPLADVPAAYVDTREITPDDPQSEWSQ